MDIKTLSGWVGGNHNLSGRVPEGFVLDSLNVDVTPAGLFSLRPGFEQVYAGTNIAGVVALNDKLLIADDGNLVEFNTRTATARTLRAIQGGITGDVLNDRLYFCTANEALEYDGQGIRPWGVPSVMAQPAVYGSTGGSLEYGYYKIAMTLMDAWGREGGTDQPLLIRAREKLVITIPTIPAGYSANLYVSKVEGQTLYLQDKGLQAGVIELTAARDDTATLETVGLRPPAVGTRVLAYNGMLLVVSGKTLEMTLPLRPHLVNRVSGFVQYPVEIGEVMSDRRTVFVSADRTYALNSLEGGEISQAPISEATAVPGTGIRLPDDANGRCACAWMTERGQAISSDAGLTYPNKDHYAPALGATGSAGVVDHNGNRTIVTAMRGRNRVNQLAAADFFTAKVINP
jgi:hypothetical protein